LTVTVGMSVDQFGQMTLMAVRYALGRRTGVPDDAARMVRAGWDQIPDRWQTLIARDVRYELALAGYSRRLVGDKCDHETWTDLLAWIESRPATASAPQQRAEGDDRKGPS
jgi:hypothetical protein